MVTGGLKARGRTNLNVEFTCDLEWNMTWKLGSYTGVSKDCVRKTFYHKCIYSMAKRACSGPDTGGEFGNTHSAGAPHKFMDKYTGV